MANTFLKGDVIAATALGLLERELVLGSLVMTDPGADFAGAKNDTVTIRVPATLNAREYNWRNDRASDIVLDDIVEDSVAVALNKDFYSAVAISDEQLSLDIKDFASQVLAPQVRAVATAFDSGIASLISGATYQTTVAMDATDPFAAFVDARAALNKAHVPSGGRVMLVGADIETALLKSDRVSDVSKAGADTALREATVGRLAGFEIVSSSAIPATEAFAFVPSAFIAATRAPAIPQGATFGSSQAYNGLSLRWIKDYDAAKLRDRSIVNLYAGFSVVQDPISTSSKKLLRAVKINLTPVGP